MVRAPARRHRFEPAGDGPRTMPNGIEVGGEGEWHARKHGGSKRRVRRRIHLGIDSQTLEIRAAESSPANATGPKEPVGGSHIGDAPVLPDLLGQIPPEQEVGSVTADGARDTRNCHDAIAHRGAHASGYFLEPVTFVSSLPPQRNAEPWNPATAGALAIVLGPMADKARHVTTPCERRNTWDGRSGETGVETTAEAVPR